MELEDRESQNIARRRTVSQQKGLDWSVKMASELRRCPQVALTPLGVWHVTCVHVRLCRFQVSPPEQCYCCAHNLLLLAVERRGIRWGDVVATSRHASATEHMHVNTLCLCDSFWTARCATLVWAVFLHA